jgi:hypothetical protein
VPVSLLLISISADIKAAVSSMVAIGNVSSTRMYSPKVLSLSAFDLHTSDSGYCIARPSLIYILLIAAIALPVRL